MKTFLKKCFFPGLDLHTRSRYRHLPKEFMSGPKITLDAGCGNGALSYAAFKKGNTVLGVSFSLTEIQKAKVFFSRFDTTRLSFDVMNLYHLDKLETGRFDQIICSETLEHIQNDRLIIEQFYRLLKPGGILHLCCPNAEHREHALGRTDDPEDGGHVRDGYTLESYKRLFEDSHFEIVKNFGIGTPAIVKMDKIVASIQNRFGNIFATPVFLFFVPFLKFLDKKINPSKAYSIYLTVVKRNPNIEP
ncbi:MAG: class I SAM-dependent methyltransferase [Candidatus Omnitrophica bacterium]|nr:class I SAM-dependent methyltransferase [Candidatus Omnitrophota bacterium]